MQQFLELWFIRTNVTDVQLINSVGPLDGKVQVRVEGKWASVCDQGETDVYDVFCRTVSAK